MAKEQAQVITRFPPSPTGFLHVGSARTALFNYLFAKKHGGKMYLRLEDTDKARSKPEYEKDILEGLEWLGLSYDPMPGEKPFWRQSERANAYKGYVQKLIDSGAAYISKETPKEEGQRDEVIRFKNPNRTVTFNDLVRGEISFDTTDLGDFVIARTLEEPLYHLAVVIDDHESGITHVIRGEDHISNTPRQILLQEALGFQRPVYAHIPLILDTDRTKLSKRKHGEKVSIKHYKDEGYLPEAIINFLALLGWNPGDDREVFSLSELVEEFDISRVQKGGAIFNIEKLNWLNREYLLKTSEDDKIHMVSKALADAGRDTDRETVARLVPTVFERISIQSDIRKKIDGGDLAYLQDPVLSSKSAILWKDEQDPNRAGVRLAHVIAEWERIGEEAWNQENLKNSVWNYAEKEGKGAVLWPTRYSLSGMERSPDPFTLAYILGKRKTLDRLQKAQKFLSS